MRIVYRVCTWDDEEAVAALLWSTKEEQYISERSTTVEIARLLFEKGGVIAGYDGKNLAAMLGYFRGEPSRDYTNKEIGFLYVGGVAQPYRYSRVAWNCFYFTLKYFEKLSIQEIRCHASIHNPYTNRMYAHFAKVLGRDVTRRGSPAILYGSTVDEALGYVRRGRTENDVFIDY